MLKTLSVGGSVALLATAGFAQQSAEPTPIRGQVKNAGTLNLATGTWTRTQHDTGGVKLLYNNDINTGFYYNSGVRVPTDEGRLPGTADATLPNVKADAYTVTGFQFAYCFSDVSANNTQNYAFFEAYSSCTDPSGLTPAAAFTATGLPGSSAVGVLACWIVTFDFSGSTLEFGMQAEADGIFDNDAALDNFGFQYEMASVVPSVSKGALICGDPNNFPHGDGTYYQSPGSQGTGLGQADQYWAFDPSGATVTGCYWFGGYPANPWGGFWLQVSGENADGGGDNCTKYCQANPNSTGSPASITSNCNFSGSNLTVTSQPVPNQPGIFFHALNQASLAFGNGFLCATGNIVRTGVVVGAGNQASRTIDFSAFSGTTRQTQYWYRDPAGGGAFFNTSNAITVDVP